jgi:hypothetical protein
MELDYNAIMAWAAVAAALIAVITVWFESRRSRFSTGVDLILRLDNDFNSPHFKEIRKQAAVAFSSGDYSSGSNAIDSILNFFEGVAFFTKRGAVDKKTVWHFFFTYMYRFWHFADKYMKKEREADPTLWTACIDLYSQLLKIEKQDRQRLGGDINLSEEDLEKFLSEELKL